MTSLQKDRTAFLQQIRLLKAAADHRAENSRNDDLGQIPRDKRKHTHGQSCRQGCIRHNQQEPYGSDDIKDCGGRG